MNWVNYLPVYNKRMTETELQWKQFPDFPAYVVSSRGDVLNQRRGTYKRQWADKDGYLRVCLHTQDKKKTRKRKVYLVHRLVASLYDRQYADDKYVHHRDRDRKNNDSSNLCCQSFDDHMLEHHGSKYEQVFVYVRGTDDLVNVAYTIDDAAEYAATTPAIVCDALAGNGASELCPFFEFRKF